MLCAYFSHVFDNFDVKFSIDEFVKFATSMPLWLRRQKQQYPDCRQHIIVQHRMVFFVDQQH